MISNEIVKLTAYRVEHHLVTINFRTKFSYNLTQYLFNGDEF